MCVCMYIAITFVCVYMSMYVHLYSHVHIHTERESDANTYTYRCTALFIHEFIPQMSTMTRLGLEEAGNWAFNPGLPCAWLESS